MRESLKESTIRRLPLGIVLPLFLVTFVLFAIAVVVQFVNLESEVEMREQFVSLAIDLLAGSLISFIFYYLVVYLPEQQRQEILKKRLRQNYLYIKRAILTSVVLGSIHGGRNDLRDEGVFAVKNRLMDVTEFKREFSGGGQSHEGYYAFSNHMSDNSIEFQEIVLRISHLKSQIALALHNYPFADETVAEQFHLLEMRLTRLERVAPGSDSSEPLLGFIFEVFAGWDMVNGFTGRDYILTAIESM